MLFTYTINNILFIIGTRIFSVLLEPDEDLQVLNARLQCGQ
jgi:hypothetical protein